jgi:hypothetical protein
MHGGRTHVAADALHCGHAIQHHPSRINSLINSRHTRTHQHTHHTDTHTHTDTTHTHVPSIPERVREGYRSDPVRELPPRLLLAAHSERDIPPPERDTPPSKCAREGGMCELRGRVPLGAHELTHSLPLPFVRAYLRAQVIDTLPYEALSVACRYPYTGH